MSSLIFIKNTVFWVMIIVDILQNWTFTTAINVECDDGFYGIHCQELCHCKNDKTCNKTNGYCINGCDIMWGGDFCSEYKGLDFWQKTTTVTQIGTFAFNDAKKAIDGVNNYRIDTCMCCSVAVNNQGENTAWWQIDLGKKYLIDALSLFGRSDESNQLQIQEAAVYAGNQSLSADFLSGSLIYNVPSNIGNKFHFIHQLNSPIVARFFIVRIHQNILTLCEFMLRETECFTGNFGEGCSHFCHCKHGTSCDSVTGYCYEKECDAGWQGDACDRRCVFPSFGDGCNSTCHCGDCEPVNGTCLVTQCDPGWIGPSCSQECYSGNFGEGCSHFCHCKNGTSCDSVTGYCYEKECDAGWQGDACDTKCEFPSFGGGCNSICHCADCDPVNGTCFVTHCDSGWKGPSCSQENNIVASINGKLSTHMSSVYNETWESYLAIDGNIGPDPSKCKCCAKTQNAAMSWWTVDLGQQFPISSILLFGRNEVPSIGQELEGFEIILSNTGQYDETVFYTDEFSPVGRNPYVVQVHNQLARFIKVQRPGVLTLCEVVVQEGECKTGYFGADCSRKCNCLDNKPCTRDGVCSTDVCELGWRGVACDKECLPGTFGVQCRKHCFCANGANCTKDYGICPGTCKEGYQGPQCNKEIVHDYAQKNNLTDAGSPKTSIPLIIGVSTGTTILIGLVASFTFFSIYRKRTQTRAQDNATYMQPNVTVATNDDLSYEPVNAPDHGYNDLILEADENTHLQTENTELKV